MRWWGTFILVICSLWSNGSTQAMEISNIFRKPALEESLQSPPVEPSLIDYIASSLESKECQTVFAMLTIQDSALKMRHSMNLSSTKDYAGYLQQAHDQLQGSYVKDFNCTGSLKYWNEKMVGTSSKDDRDKLAFAETVLGVCLSAVGRPDLDKLLHVRIKQIKHKDLEELKDEIESHTAWIRPSNGTYNRLHSQRNVTGTTPQEDDGFGAFVTFLIIFFFVCICACCFLLTVATCYSDPKLDSRPKYPQQYRRINLVGGGGGGENDKVSVSSGTNQTPVTVKKASGKSESRHLLESKRLTV